MSFGVCFHFELNDLDVWSGRQIDLDAWRYALKAFGGNRLAMINLCNAQVQISDESIQFEQHASLNAFLEAHPTDTKVYVEIGGENLDLFEHPNECWYVFGGAQVSLPRADVGIPTPFALHPIHVEQIVLWDRFRKGAN